MNSREETVVVLANAMYLKASWAVVFERVETLGTFTLADGATVETEYMAHDHLASPGPRLRLRRGGTAL